MNNTRLAFRSLALLALAVGAAAPSFGGSIHADLVFNEISTTYSYANGVKAAWRVKPQPPQSTDRVTNPGRLTYELTLSGLAADENYSLATVGLQGRLCPVAVTAAVNAKFGSLADAANHKMSVLQLPKVIGQVGVKADDVILKPDEVRLDGDDVWFVAAEDSTKPVVITAVPLDRGHIGTTNWYDAGGNFHTGYGSSHDTIPTDPNTGHH